MYSIAPARQPFLSCRGRFFTTGLSLLYSKAPEHFGSEFPSGYSTTGPQEDKLEDEEWRKAAERKQEEWSSSFTPSQPRLRRGFKHLDLEHDKVALGINSLGTPAQIRIFRDKPRPPRVVVDSQVRVERTDDASESNEVLHALAAGRSPANLNTVKDNIEEVRRTFFSIHKINNELTAEQCAALSQELHDSFTARQLQGYLNDLKPPRYDDMERPYESELIKRAEWFGETSEFPAIAIERLMSKGYHKKARSNRLSNVSLQGDAMGASSPAMPKGKMLVISNILHECWKIRDVTQKQHGELDFQVRPEHLHMLLNHHQNILQKLSEQFNAKIEVSSRESIIRLSGDYDLTCDVYKLVYRTLENIKEYKMDLEDLFNKSNLGSKANDRETLDLTINPAYLEQVEKLTHTRIIPPDTRSSNPSEFRIIYVGPNTTDLDDVRRVILQTMEPKSSLHTQLRCDLSMSGSVPIEVPVEPGSVLPLKDRFTKWSRWRQSAPTDNVTHSLSESKDLSESVRQHLLSIWAPDPKPKACHVRCETWKEDERGKSATLGWIAHPSIGRFFSAGVQRKTYGAKDVRDWAARFGRESEEDKLRSLIPDVPGLVAALPELITSKPTVSDEFHIQLRPRKMTPDSVSTLSLPNIELVLKIVGATRKVEPLAARLVHAWKETDLLIPWQAADIRFNTRASLLSTSTMDPAIIKFLEESNLDVWGNERLKTPARLKLTIPASAWKRVSSLADSLGGSNSDLEVEYTFASLEHRSSMSMDFKGYPLRYTTVEAGKTGGRRSELVFETTDRLPAGEPEAGRSDIAARRFDDWFSTVRQLAAMIPM